MKKKNICLFFISDFCNMYFQTLFVNSIDGEEIRCNNCCSQDEFPTFQYHRCSSSILSNDTFVRCKMLEHIIMDCSFEPEVNFKITSIAFQNLQYLSDVDIKNYNVIYVLMDFSTTFTNWTKYHSSTLL